MTLSVTEKVIRGETLTKGELASFIGGYLSGGVSRDDMTAFLRAVCARGLSEASTIALTEAMLESGDRMSFTPRGFPYADKHSTGGLADSTTLVVAPVVASCGVPFLKMSGRKLGHTGGTIDKLELFRGLRTDLSIEEAESIVDEVGAAIVAQTKDLVPADKALYKLRDETNTVRSIPLIASSVVSKKLAGGADVFVLDVKTGSGAFAESTDESVILAKLMVKILASAGKKAAAVISDMNSPLGDHIGGELEVSDALEALEGRGGRLSELSVTLASHILSMAKGISLAEAEKEARSAILSGAAREKLMDIIRAQGGETTLFDPEYRARYRAHVAAVIPAEADGCVSHIDCVALGFAAREAEKAGGYGIYAPHKVGSRVKKGEPLFILYGETAPSEDAVLAPLRACVTLSETAPVYPLVFDIIEG